jgi:hypothetical protein
VDVPAIVSHETWEAAKERLEANRRNVAHRRRKHKYLVGGRVTCGACGLKMAGDANGRADKPNLKLYYRCLARTNIEYARECELRSFFRADHVDAAVWEWVKSLLSDPEVLAQTLGQVQQEREQENAPIRDRLAVVDDLLAENQGQLERLLDLYLSGEFPKEVLTDRKARLEGTISALEKEQAGLVAHLETRVLSVEQIQTLQEFAAKVGKNLDAMDSDFGAKRRLMDDLDVQVTLGMKDGQKWIFASCMIGEGDCELSPTTRGTACHFQLREALRFTLVLFVFGMGDEATSLQYLAIPWKDNECVADQGHIVWMPAEAVSTETCRPYLGRPLCQASAAGQVQRFTCRDKIIHQQHPLAGDSRWWSKQHLRRLADHPIVVPS